MPDRRAVRTTALRASWRASLPPRVSLVRRSAAVSRACEALETVPGLGWILDRPPYDIAEVHKRNLERDQEEEDVPEHGAQTSVTARRASIEQIRRRSIRDRRAGLAARCVLHARLVEWQGPTGPRGIAAMKTRVAPSPSDSSSFDELSATSCAHETAPRFVLSVSVRATGVTCSARSWKSHIAGESAPASSSRTRASSREPVTVSRRRGSIRST